MALEGTHEEPGTFTSGVRDDAPTFGLIVSKSDEGGFPAESFFNVHPIIERVPVNGETQTMISEGPVTLVAPILAVEPRVVFPRPVIGNTPPDLNDILPLLDLDSGRPIAELIHALHVPEEPVDNCPRDIKWNNPPNPNDEGTPIPSNIDWNDHDPNKVTADDLVSNGRPILVVRSWGSYLDRRFLPEELGGNGEREIDCWYISFHADREQKEPEELLGLYFCRTEDIQISRTLLRDCEVDRSSSTTSSCATAAPFTSAFLIGELRTAFPLESDASTRPAACRAGSTCRLLSASRTSAGPAGSSGRTIVPIATSGPGPQVASHRSIDSKRSAERSERTTTTPGSTRTGFRPTIAAEIVTRRSSSSRRLCDS